MWTSFRLFLIDVIKNGFFWLSVLIDIYALFINPLLPRKYYMPTLGIILFGFIILFFAGLSSYHKLRMESLEKFVKFFPEAHKDKIFRIFYKLYQEGVFYKKTTTKQRQKWDEDILIEIDKYCRIEFKNNYLSSTGRRNWEFTPLTDNNYDKALSALKYFIDRDFDCWIKI